MNDPAPDEDGSPASKGPPSRGIQSLSEADIERLLRLKGEEQPPEGYVERFLVEFHVRQRSELLRGSARSLVWERFTTWLWRPSRKGWRFLIVGAGGLVFIGSAVGRPAECASEERRRASFEFRTSSFEFLKK